MKILFYKLKEVGGAIRFVLFDLQTKQLVYCTYDEIVAAIQRKEIRNAKLENTVVKITDSNYSLITIQSKSQPVLWYALEKNEEGYLFVNSEGAFLYMPITMPPKKIAASLNPGTLINAKITLTGLYINGATNYDSALSRDYSHTQTRG